jgi:hypothetical protein
VLHLKANPTNGFGAQQSVSSASNSLSSFNAGRDSIGKSVIAGAPPNVPLSIETLSSELHGLKEENRRLKEAIIRADSNLSIAGPSGDNDNGNVSMTLNTSTVASKSTAVDAEKLNNRLKAMFREKIACFREAVYLLTGYKVRLSCLISNLFNVNTNALPVDRRVLCRLRWQLAYQVKAAVHVFRRPRRLFDVSGEFM